MSLLKMVVAVLLCVLAAAGTAAAQTNLQLWGDLSLNWVRSPRASWSLDLEPQALVASTGETVGWYTFGVTPNFEYAAKRRLDVVTEVGTGVTKQTDGLNSLEITPRGGVRLYLLSRDVPNLIDRYIPHPMSGERPTKRRLIVRNRFLVESRNIFYNHNQPTSSTVRLRNRLELLFSLNRADVAENHSRTLLADWEWFVPFGVEAAERFASRQRIRTGIAFRRSFEWRSEIIYVWTRSRDTTDEPFSTSDNAISITVRRFFRK
jgi:hypothetical protein